MSSERDYGQYFIPKQAYAVDDLAGSPAVWGGMICVKNCKVSRVGFVIVTTVLADAVAAQVEFNRRPTIASATGEVLMGTVIIPDEAAVGAVYYTDIDPVSFAPGEELSFEHTVAADDSGSQAGTGYYVFEFQDDPEYVSNSTNMIESA